LDQLRCTQCAAESYSAAARTLVEQGYRCPVCGGEVVLVPQEPPVGVALESDGDPGDAGRERRFES
jgi:DNA-directed RNA polymerase subunit RPC12/RpoP